MNADDIDLTGTITASGHVSLAPASTDRAVLLGGNSSDSLSLTEAELNRISSPGLTIGEYSNTAGITVEGAVNLSSLTGGTLELESAGDITFTASAGASVAAIVSGAATSVIGALNVTGDVTMNADDIRLMGGTITASGHVRLVPTTPNRTVLLGSNSSESLSLTAAELSQISSPGGLTIGGPHAGSLSVLGDVNLSGLTGGTLVLESPVGVDGHWRCDHYQHQREYHCWPRRCH